MTIRDIVKCIDDWNAEEKAAHQRYYDNEREEEYTVKNSITVDDKTYLNSIRITYVPFDSSDIVPGKYESHIRWTLSIKDDHKSIIYFRKSVLFPREKVVLSDSFCPEERTYFKRVERIYSGEATFNDQTISPDELYNLMSQSAKIQKIVEDKVTYFPL